MNPRPEGHGKRAEDDNVKALEAVSMNPRPEGHGKGLPAPAADTIYMSQ